MRSSSPIHPLWCRCGCARPHRRRSAWHAAVRQLRAGAARLLQRASDPGRQGRALLGLLLLAGMLAGLTLFHFAPAVAAAFS